ncbi:GYF domain-containing protein [Hyphococcus sp.]|uniref:GYF domain-containing protein n=1 Tax=Hyphococcus sp. TaxID=2038636 RepID=UPI00207ED738|nr:MAG: hypothetical protein DHS20C04_22630 [Marinicaulis sp.]
MLAAENWCIKVQEKVYGPYTTQQMRKFAREGRLAAWSLISPAGGRSWREARSELVFSNFFSADRDNAATPKAVVQSKSFGRRSDCDSVINEDAPRPRQTTKQASKANTARAAKTDNAADVSSANFVVIFDVVSAAASRVEAAMLSLGPAFRIADNVWHVSCELTAVGVRNAIAPYLRGSESIFVVDASRGRSSWSNYAPEPNAKLSAAYFRNMQH